MFKAFRQVGWVCFIAVLLLTVPRLAGRVADLFDYSNVDPDGVFAWISVHHIVQALIFLIIMVAIAKVSPLRFGFGWGERNVGLFYVRLFAMIFGIYTLVSLILLIPTGSFRLLPYPLTGRNIVGQLGFQLLLSGPSEELIFRAFAITMLGLSVKGRVFGGRLGTANIIAAIVFGLAHVGWTWVPFSVTYDPFQVVYATGLGLAYGACYERSNSMIYPMAMHSISNVVAVLVAVIAGFMLR